VTAAIATAVVASGCQESPSPPYGLAFSLDAPSVRVLRAGRETTVPVSLGNVGLRSWDPERVHLSYHWLWLIPRELAHRTRTQPYHDGIRTELGAPLPPGARTELSARLLAPRLPGLYWLQWDMVEEDVAWFAQLAPRHPRRLVLVLPTFADVFAPIPLLLAIAGAIGVRRLVAADLIWCSATLLAKQLIVFDQVVLEPTPAAYWLAVVAALVPPLVLLALVGDRRRAVAMFVLGAFGSILMLGDVVYYRFFGDVLSAPALLALGQTGRVTASIRSLFTANLLWFVADLPCAAWLCGRVWSGVGRAVTSRQKASWAAASIAVLAMGGVTASARSELTSAPLAQMFRDRSVVEQLGPLGYHAYDAWNYGRAAWLRPPLSAADLEDAISWFAERAPLRAGAASPLFGKARGRSIIVIQVESLQDFVVDYRVGDQEVMPHLRGWSTDGIRFTGVSDQTNEGRTSDAEFVALTSLLPIDHGAVAFRYPGNHYVALPRVLADHGYATLSAVAFEAGFWNRRVLHPRYGFERSLFEPDFSMTEQIGWGLNDRDFLLQMVPRLERLRRPFLAWLITLSLHHPFDGFPDRHKTLKLGGLEGTSFGNYLHTMRFFDQALEEFKAALARDGLLDDVVLMVFGDHDAGFPRDPAIARAMGVAGTEAGWTLADRVPLFVRAPALLAATPSLPHVVPAAMGQSDFAPTLLSLVGIDAAALPFVGRNVLGRPGDAPVVRPYGDWIDRSHLFLNRGAVERGPVCYQVLGLRQVETDSCGPTTAAAALTRKVSRLVIGEDLQQRVGDRLRQIVR
jgi:phosphoglycerol transferase MdoB-like AlkP superfamily enzyme